MINKNIFDPDNKTQLENELNKIIYAYVARGQYLLLPSNSETFVKEGYAGNVNVYSIIRRIVQPAIGVKWGIVDENGEEVEGSELERFLKTPNPNQSFNEFIDEQITGRLTTGNSYIYVISIETGSNKGKPAELWSLPPQNTEIVSGGTFQPIKEYHLTIGATTQTIPAESVIHSKYVNLKYGTFGEQLYGMSPIEAALKVMTATNSGYDTMSKQFENGGPDIIITGTKDTATQEWNEEQFQTVWQRFKDKFRRGSKERYMLKNLPVEVHEIGKSLVDMNVLEFMKLSLRDYCNIYGVPSALMNDNQYATQSANNREFMRQLWNNAVIPELERTKDALNKIAQKYNQATGKIELFDYDLSDIPELQADIATMSGALNSAWWLTPNQRLAAMNLPESENPLMNDVYMPMGMVSISDMGMEDESDEALKNLKY